MITVEEDAPQWARNFAFTIQREIDFIFSRPVRIPAYTVANLPDASKFFSDNTRYGYSAMIFVTNETGGSVPAFTDGTNWRRVTDRAVVS